MTSPSKLPMTTPRRSIWPPPRFGLRVLAKLADLLVVNLVLVALLCLFAVLQAAGLPGTRLLPWLGGVFLFVCVFYQAVGTSGGRQTLGYRLAALRLSLARGRPAPAGLGRCVVRSLLDWLCYGLMYYGVGLLDYLPVAVTPSKRALHDLATGTRVVRVGWPHYPALAAGAVGLLVLPLTAVFGVVRPLLMQAYVMPGPGMTPTLPIGCRFIVNKLSYRRGDPERGDIVVFRPPDGSPGPLPGRIVGLPGDQLRVTDGRVYLYGQGPLPEPYVQDDDAGPPPPDSPDAPGGWFAGHPAALVEHAGVRWVRVPSDAYFVLGDNRGDSTDSRDWGFLPRGHIIGKVTLMYSPWLQDF